MQDEYIVTLLRSYECYCSQQTSCAGCKEDDLQKLVASRIANSIISRNGHNRYQEINHELIFCDQRIKKGKVTGEESFHTGINNSPNAP